MSACIPGSVNCTAPPEPTINPPPSPTLPQPPPPSPSPIPPSPTPSPRPPPQPSPSPQQQPPPPPNTRAVNDNNNVNTNVVSQQPSPSPNVTSNINSKSSDIKETKTPVPTLIVDSVESNTKDYGNGTLIAIIVGGSLVAIVLVIAIIVITRKRSSNKNHSLHRSTTALSDQEFKNLVDSSSSTVNLTRQITAMSHISLAAPGGQNMNGSNHNVADIPNSDNFYNQHHHHLLHQDANFDAYNNSNFGQMEIIPAAAIATTATVTGENTATMMAQPYPAIPNYESDGIVPPVSPVSMSHVATSPTSLYYIPSPEEQYAAPLHVGYMYVPTLDTVAVTNNSTGVVDQEEQNTQQSFGGIHGEAQN